MQRNPPLNDVFDMDIVIAFSSGDWSSRRGDRIHVSLCTSDVFATLIPMYLQDLMGSYRGWKNLHAILRVIIGSDDAVLSRTSIAMTKRNVDVDVVLSSDDEDEAVGGRVQRS